MLTSILIAVVSLIILFIIHELGHFILARLFGMPVEEFGIGLPPRLISKKIKGIVYSINWIPFGAFVSIRGEDEKKESGPSFKDHPLWQRIIVFLGGVVATWVAAAILYSLIAGIWGLPAQINDDIKASSAELRITQVKEGSLSEEAGLVMGDKVIKISSAGTSTKVNKIEDLDIFLKKYNKNPVELTVLRSGQETNFTIPANNETATNTYRGIEIARVGYVSFSWWEAPRIGLSVAANQTIEIPKQLSKVAYRYFAKGEKTPGVKFVGPVGVGETLSYAAEVGFNYLLQFVALIAIYLSIFNLLPLPALDGGKILLAVISSIRGHEINPQTENAINNIFFFAILALLFLVTIKDIIRLVT